MSDTFTQFEKRCERLTRKHRAFSNGCVARLDVDGLDHPCTQTKTRRVMASASLLLLFSGFSRLKRWQ